MVEACYFSLISSKELQTAMLVVGVWNALGGVGCCLLLRWIAGRDGDEGLCHRTVRCHRDKERGGDSQAWKAGDCLVVAMARVLSGY